MSYTKTDIQLSKSQEHDKFRTAATVKIEKNRGENILKTYRKGMKIR